MNKKRAIISVYNKEGLSDFANQLTKELNYELISTGGSRKALEKAGIKAKKVSSLTDFPEILDGRVKTLHPKIFGGILANQNDDEHKETLKKHSIKPISLVVVNLYPFREMASAKGATIRELVENIDIGGSALLRSAAKNYENVVVICSPEDYNMVIKEMLANKGETTIETRKKLAIKAFEHTYNYDRLIHKTLFNKFNLEESSDTYRIELNKIQELRYGENPHQKAAIYAYSDASKLELPYEILQGKELSYNNLTDITSALRLLDEFNETPAACIIKHNNPCGVALGKTHLEAYKKALSADPISAFGGIVGINGSVDRGLAEILYSLFLEVIIANDYTEEALSILAKKKNLRLIKVSSDINLTSDYCIRQVAGGVLIQDTDSKKITKDDFKVVSKKTPSDAELDDLLFAWKVCKHVTSNAIVIAKNVQTVGIGCGQTSRIGAMEIALRQACDNAKDAAVASDGFFPAIDNIQAAAQNRVSTIIQPGGSIKDKDVIATIDKLGLSMVLTGVRHFKH